MSGFKNFILRGNLVELAVAFIMATAFAAVIKATVDLLLGIVGKAGGYPDFSQWTPWGFLLGVWVTALVTFVITGAVVYYVVVVPYTEAKERSSRAPSPERRRTSSSSRRSATCWSSRAAALRRRSPRPLPDSRAREVRPVIRSDFVASAVVGRHLRAQPAVAGVLDRRVGRGLGVALV